jgi:beta-phosphoglucomutase
MNVAIPLSGIKAAIFDMDGTMINNMAAHRQAWKEFLKRHNIQLTDEEYRAKINGKKNDAIFELVFNKPLSEAEMEAYTEEKEGIYREIYAPDIKEISGLTQVVAELQQKGLMTAIATTAPAKNRDFALRELGLEGKFGVILGEEHVKQGKPNPEIYLSAARELGVSPGQCLVFEDSPPGVASAKAAGMTVVGILSSHAAHEISTADYTADDFTQLRFV